MKSIRSYFFALEDCERHFRNVAYLLIQAALKENIPSLRMQLFHFALSRVLHVHHHFIFNRLLLTRLFVRPSDLGLLYTMLYRWNCGLLTTVGNVPYCDTFTLSFLWHYSCKPVSSCL